MDYFTSEIVGKDIASMNAIYLAALRDLAVRDIKQAVLRFGVSAAVAARVAGYSAADIQQVAQGAYLVFRPRDEKMLTCQDAAERLARALSTAGAGA